MPLATTPKTQKGVFARMGTSAKQWAAAFLGESNQISQADTFMYGAGSTTVSSLLGFGRRAAKSRQGVYDKWSQMESDPVISSALLLLCTTALGGHETSGQTVFIEVAPQSKGDKKRVAMVEEMSRDLTEILNKVAFQCAYTGAAFGDAYARIYSDSRGVIDLYIDEMIRPPLIQPFERGSRTIGYALYIGERNFERLDLSQLARLKMPRTQWVPQHGVVEKSLRIALTENNIDNLPIMPAMAGGSLLYNAEEAYDNFQASLMGLVGQRWMDSIDEQIITANMDSMTKDQQDTFTESIVGILKRSKQLADKAVKSGRPIMERIRHIIPVFNEKQLTQMSPANSGGSGRQGNISTEDVIFHAKMLSGALGVDLSMLGFADMLSGGLGDGGFFRMSAQAAERSRVIRIALAEMFNQIIDIHTLKRYGVVFESGDRPWAINFYGSISALESEKQRTKADAMNGGMMLVQAMQMMKELGASKDIMASFLSQTMMLDEEQAKLYATIVDVRPPSEDEGG
jgi:hypothetical protein